MLEEVRGGIEGQLTLHLILQSLSIKVEIGEEIIPIETEECKTALDLKQNQKGKEKWLKHKR